MLLAGLFYALNSGMVVFDTRILGDLKAYAKGQCTAKHQSTQISNAFELFRLNVFIDCNFHSCNSSFLSLIINENSDELSHFLIRRFYFLFYCVGL